MKKKSKSVDRDELTGRLLYTLQSLINRPFLNQFLFNILETNQRWSAKSILYDSLSANLN